MSYNDKKSSFWQAIKFVGCLVVVLGLVGFLIVNLIFPGPYTSTYPRPFDTQVWNEADTWSYDRCGMVADLRFRIGLEGKTKQEVEALLGPDENEAEDTNLSHWHLCPSFLDIWILEVRWQSGRVSDSWVRDT